MRQIKLRGKSLVNDKYYGIKRGDFVCGSFVETNIDCQILFGDGEQVEVDRKTLGQFIGLKDFDGVEVYEGDQFHDGINICTIVFCNETASFRAFDGFEYHELGEHTSRANIIGNVHDKAITKEIGE